MAEAILFKQFASSFDPSLKELGKHCASVKGRHPSGIESGALVAMIRKEFSDH